MNKILLFLIIFLLVISAGIYFYNKEKEENLYKDEKTVIQGGLKNAELELSISPDGHIVAYALEDGDKMSVVINGKESKKYYSVGDIEFSPDSKTIAYEAMVEDDNEEEYTNFIVVDNKESKRYDVVSFLNSDFDSNRAFSPDSQKLAYIADKDGKTSVVLNDEEGKWYESIRDVVFSPNSKILAYIAGDNQFSIDQKEEFVVVNGIEGKKYNSITNKPYQSDVIFSPDSRSIAFSVTEKEGSFVVVNNEEKKKYENVNNFIFSPDSQHLAYVAGQKGKNFVVIDDVEEKKQYDEITFLTFSPDSKKIIYIAKERDKKFVIVDGKEEKRYDNIYNPQISLDGKTILYGATEKFGTTKKSFVVVNGNEGKKYNSNVIFPTFFSDSKLIVYQAKESDKMFMVFNNQEGKKYNMVWFPKFSPDGKNKFYVAEENKKLFLVINDKEEEKYLQLTEAVFLKNNIIRYFAYDGESIYRITKKISD